MSRSLNQGGGYTFQHFDLNVVFQLSNCWLIYMEFTAEKNLIECNLTVLNRVISVATLHEHDVNRGDMWTTVAQYFDILCDYWLHTVSDKVQKVTISKRMSSKRKSGLALEMKYVFYLI